MGDRRQVAEALLAALGDRMERLSIDKGETLFLQGDEDDRLFVLRSGGLEVSVLSADGRKLTVNLISRTAVFGEVALFDPGPRTATVRATARSELSYITRRAIRTAMAEDPDVGMALLSFAGARLRWVIEQLSEQVFLTPAARLAARLIYYADQGDSNRIKINQAELADMVGVTREAVSKTISRWKRDGLVEVSRGSITLRDLDRLEDEASQDYF